MLAEQLLYWGAGTLQQKLDRAYQGFVGWCRANKISHSQAPFTVKMALWQKDLNNKGELFFHNQVRVSFVHCRNFLRVVWKSFWADPAQVHKKTGDILLTAKAWNGRLICAWLADTVTVACAGVDPNYDSGRFVLVQVGQGVLTDLATQRETILNVRGNVRTIDSELSSARRSLDRMLALAQRNRITTLVIAGVFSLGISFWILCVLGLSLKSTLLLAIAMVLFLVFLLTLRRRLQTGRWELPIHY
eukprot:s83_g35.t1